MTSSSRSILLSLAALATVASLSAQISSERPVSTPVYEAVSPSGFQGFAAASEENGFLVAWTDGTRLRAVPLGADGSPLSPAAIVLAASSIFDYMRGVAVVWSDDAYTVFWSKLRLDGTAPMIVMERVAADGHIVSESKTIASPGSIGQFHAAAANGGHIVLSTTAGYIVLDQQGNQIGSGPFGSATYIGSVFSTGSAELTLLNAFGSMRLDATGKFGPPTPRTSSTYGPRLACHGDDCLIVYQSGMYAGALLTAARFNGVTSEVGEAVVLPVGASLQYDLAATPAGYVVTTPTSILRLDESGRSQGITPLPSSESWSAIEAVSSGRGTLVLLAGKTLSTSLITSSGVSQRVVVARVANSQGFPAIATSGTQYLTVWRESHAVYAARLTMDGTPLDGRGILLGSVNADAPTETPSVAFDGQTYTVAFQTSAGPAPFVQTSQASTQILHIDPRSGDVISRQTICGRSLRIAGGAGILNAAWIDCAGDVVAGPLSSFPAIVAKPAYGSISTYPSLAWNGSNWLVTWEEQYLDGLGPEPYNFSFYTAAIRAARLSMWLTLIDTKPVEVATNGSGIIVDSRVASDGSGFLVAWESLLNGEIHARRVASSGVTDGSDTVVMGGGIGNLLWDGKEYALGFYKSAPPYVDRGVGIAHIRSSGDPIPFETLAVGTTPDDESSPSILSLGDGHVVAAYTRFAHESLYGGASRVFVTTPRQPRGRASRGSS
jgi:hypothetical protein